MNGNSDNLKELDDFLRSSATNVETIAPQLKKHIHVKTGLEKVLEEALARGQPVVIAGTAGSGKTHLLRHLDIPGDYRTVEDLTQAEQGEWKTLFEEGQKTLVAGNEGAFHIGREKNYEGFKEVIELLHNIQLGEEADEGPIVIDAAAFQPAALDPEKKSCVSQMVQLPIVMEYMEHHAGGLPLEAWNMLKDDNVSRRLALLVEAAAGVGDAEGFTFRKLWKFVGDLATASKDGHGPWYTQLYERRTAVSRRVAEVLDLVPLPLPHIGNKLWYRDTNELVPLFLEEAQPALKREMASYLKAKTEPERQEGFRRLLALSVFGLKDSPLDSALHEGVTLWQDIKNRQQHSPLLTAINGYFTYGILDPPLGDELQLWIQHSTERRMLKPDSQVSLGSSQATDFEIKESLVVANLPSELKGGRLLLHHKPSKAKLVLTKDLVDGIIQGRSHLTSDRRVVEDDWRIFKFLEAVSTQAANPERLTMGLFDFQKRSARLCHWQIGTDRISKVNQ